MPGDCHYLEGNANAKRRIGHVQELLGNIGLEPERVQMFNLSAAMAGEFVRITEEMNERIKTLGPNPLRELLEGSQG
jgi:F420-non-reducing hydrogenase iron-sulfur subunit